VASFLRPDSTDDSALALVASIGNRIGEELPTIQPVSETRSADRGCPVGELPTNRDKVGLRGDSESHRRGKSK
jgi:hypothetical protein